MSSHRVHLEFILDLDDEGIATYFDRARGAEPNSHWYTDSAAVTTLCNVALHEWSRLGFLNHNGVVTGFGEGVIKGD
jgi:hypothetical protein